MSDQASQEPTMEEILASIRRIISEDDAPADAAAPAPEPEPAPAPEPEPAPAPVVYEEPAPQEEVLELTERVEPASETIGDLDVFQAPPPEPVARFEAPAPAPEPEPEPAPAFSAPAPKEEPLLTGSSADAISSAFGRLSQRIGMPDSSTTLDGVVRELLRPLLKDWLDQNLRTIVEAKVEEEVERQARRAR